MGGGEFLNDLRINDHEIIDDQVWYQGIDQLPFVKDFKTFLLVRLQGALAQLDCEGALIGFFVQAGWRTRSPFENGFSGPNRFVELF